MELFLQLNVLIALKNTNIMVLTENSISECVGCRLFYHRVIEFSFASLNQDVFLLQRRSIPLSSGTETTNFNLKKKNEIGRKKTSSYSNNDYRFIKMLISFPFYFLILAVFSLVGRLQIYFSIYPKKISVSVENLFCLSCLYIIYNTH